MTMTGSSPPPLKIADELVKLWSQEQGEKKIKASLFTFVVYVPAGKRAGYIQSTVKSVVGKLPCRVILIEGQEQTLPDIQTKVSSTTLGEGQSKIYCEIISIVASQAVMDRVPFLILPHLLPDLPIYLLWAQDPSIENSLLPHLEPYVNRIIFDAESTSNLTRYAQTILSLSSHFKREVGDLNWSAISGWRKILSQVFATADNFSSLAQSKVIRIEYNKNEKEYYQFAEIEAAYLQAWIASRLNWKIHSFEYHEGKARLVYQYPKGEVTVLLSPQEIPQCSPGKILSVEIESSKDKGHYTLKRQLSSKQVYTQYSDRHRCELPTYFHLGNLGEGQEILEEIFYPSGSTHYTAMLTTLSSIPWNRETPL